MKAVVITRYGGPEVLEVREVPEPKPSPGEELVRVKRGGLNFTDTMSTSGRYPGLPQPPVVAGRELYGTSSSDEKLERVRTLGLQHGINYKRRDYEEAIHDLTHGEGVDVVFEMLGGEHTAKSVRCLRNFGRVIVYGTATGDRAQIDPGILYAKGASIHGLWL